MNTKHLVDMANDIAQYFAFDNEHGEAVNSVATHLRKFWEVRMRKEIIAYVKHDGKGLDPLARDAVVKLEELDQQPAGAAGT